MTLRLYLDDCVLSRILRRMLAAAGRVVVVPADVGLAGADDADHFAYAREHGLVLVTMNPRHFEALRERQPDRAGILVIYRDNDPTRDMNEAEIVRAIDNLARSGVPIAGGFHALNH